MKGQLRSHPLVSLPGASLLAVGVFLCVSIFLLFGLFTLLLDFLFRRLLRLPSIFSQEFHTACATGDAPLVRQILARKPFLLSLNQQDRFGSSPLAVACQHGHVEIVRLLAGDKRVDVNLPCHDGATPFFLACQRGDLPMVEALLERANVRKSRHGAYSPFYIACYHGHVEIVRLLLGDKRVDVNQASKDGTSPFAVACLRGHVALVEELAQSERVDLNKKDNRGATAFFLTCQLNDLPLARLLATIPRLDVNRARSNGSTPLYVATANNQPKLVKIILACEREVNTRQVFGCSNLSCGQLARIKGYQEVALLIEGYEADPIAMRKVMQREVAGDIAAEFFSLMIFHSDGLLSLSPVDR